MYGDLNPECEFVLLGKLQREFILPLEGRPVINAPGGNLLYAAVGMGLWGGRAGLVARVSTDYPLEWLDRLSKSGFDLQGIIQTTETFDMRWFAAYSDSQTVHFNNPLNHFAKRGLPIPHELLAYESESGRLCNKNSYSCQSIHINDLPAVYKDVRAAHICPIDFITHKTIPSILKGGRVQTQSMAASAGYMDPLYWEEIPVLLSDQLIFLANESEAKSLFQGRSVDLWEIAEALSGYGPEYIIIHLADGSHMLFDRVPKKRWIIPAYPAKNTDPTGSLDAFAGAFLAVYCQDYDPVFAGLAGSIAASFVMEGSGPFFALDAMPGLKEARLAWLREKVVQV